MEQQDVWMRGGSAGENDLLLAATAERSHLLFCRLGFQVHPREIGIGQDFHPTSVQMAPAVALAKAGRGHVVENAQNLKRTGASAVCGNERHARPDDILGRSDSDSSPCHLDVAGKRPSSE